VPRGAGSRGVGGCAGSAIHGVVGVQRLARADPPAVPLNLKPEGLLFYVHVLT
jgi:hypothetical protein